MLQNSLDSEGPSVMVYSLWEVFIIFTDLKVSYRSNEGNSLILYMS